MPICLQLLVIKDVSIKDIYLPKELAIPSMLKFNAKLQLKQLTCGTPGVVVGPQLKKRLDGHLSELIKLSSGLN